MHNPPVGTLDLVHVDDGFALASRLNGMQSLRTANALLRLALALVFGVMSLTHGPVMAFAGAGTSPAAHELATAPTAGHHHHAAAQPIDDDPERLVQQRP